MNLSRRDACAIAVLQSLVSSRPKNAPQKLVPLAFEVADAFEVAAKLPAKKAAKKKNVKSVGRKKAPTRNAVTYLNF